MGTISNNDVIRIVAKMTLPAGVVQNVYHYRFSGTSGGEGIDLLTDIAERLDEAYAEIQPALPTTLQFASIEGFNVTRDEPCGEVDWPNLTAGGGSGQSLPPQTSALVLFNTGTARSQGRKYLPPMTETESEGGGTLTSGVQGAIADFALALLQVLTTGHGYVIPGNYNKALGRFAPWVSAIVQGFLRTQRRRVYGVGA
jgi:hypothetical protein